MQTRFLGAADYVQLPLSLLDRQSGEWNVLAAYLALCARSSRVVLSNLWAISIPDLGSDFERRSTDRLTVPCWVPVSSLDERMGNGAVNVCQRGFRIEQGGLSVHYGTLSFPEVPVFKFQDRSGRPGTSQYGDSTNARDLAFREWEARQRGLPDKARYELFLCDVCVGVPLTIETSLEASYFTSDTLPPEFDSVMVKDQASAAELGVDLTLCGGWRWLSARKESGVSAAVNSAANGASESWRCDGEDGMLPNTGNLPTEATQVTFKVFDSAQILPRFLVTVEVCPRAPELLALPFCFNCNDKPACVWCGADSASLCDTCDAALHEANPILRRHMRVPLSQRPWSSVGHCEMHTLETADFYCTFCDVPFCRVCEGSHTHGSHDLRVPILDAYLAALSAEQPVFSELLTRRRNEINAALASVDETIANINRTYDAAAKAVRDVVTVAADELKEAGERQIAQAVASKMDRVRHAHQTGRSLRFLRTLRSLLPPADYMRAALQHAKLADRQKRNAAFKTTPGTVSVVGQLRIVS